MIYVVCIAGKFPAKVATKAEAIRQAKESVKNGKGCFRMSVPLRPDSLAVIRLTEQMARDIFAVNKLPAQFLVDDSGHETGHCKPNTLETVDELGLV